MGKTVPLPRVSGELRDQGLEFATGLRFVKQKIPSNLEHPLPLMMTQETQVGLSLSLVLGDGEGTVWNSPSTLRVRSHMIPKDRGVPKFVGSVVISAGTDRVRPAPPPLNAPRYVGGLLRSRSSGARYRGVPGPSFPPGGRSSAPGPVPRVSFSPRGGVGARRPET